MALQGNAGIRMFSINMVLKTTKCGKETANDLLAKEHLLEDRETHRRLKGGSVRPTISSAAIKGSVQRLSRIKTDQKTRIM